MRKEVIGNATLYLGDCLTVLPTLPKADAVITDPPWNLGYFTDDSKPEEEYVLWLKNVIELLRAACAGPVWVFQSTKNISSVAHLFAGWGCFASIKNFCRFSSPKLIPNSWDIAFYSSSEGYLGNGRNWHLGNNANLPNVRHQMTLHPTARPLDTMEYIVSLFDADTIMDPFMGSGTTGVACATMKRNFIGIEIDPKYFDIACVRIENAQRQERLFA